MSDITTALTEQDAADEGWIFDPGDYAVGIFEGWVHDSCPDPDSFEPVEVTGAVTVLDLHRDGLRELRWIEQLRCSACGQSAAVLRQLTEPDDLELQLAAS